MAPAALAKQKWHKIILVWREPYRGRPDNSRLDSAIISLAFGKRKIETNRMNIKVSELVALKQIFNVSFDAFFEGLG